MTIQVLKSLRADTRQGKGKIRLNDAGGNSIVLERCEQYVVSFTKGRKPCIRVGQNGRRVDLNEWWTCGHDKTLYTSKVYKVTLSDDRVKAWKKRKTSYMVCRNDEHAKKMALWRFSFIVKKDRGLAKNALTKAMVLTNGKSQQITSQKTNVINQNVNV